MPDQLPAPSSVSDLEELGHLIGLAILATPGVERVEQTLVDAVRRIQQTIVRGGASKKDRDPANGVRLRRRGSHLDVAVDIAVTTSALITARAVRDHVAAVVKESGLEPGAIEVSVLAVQLDSAAEETHGFS